MTPEKNYFQEAFDKKLQDAKDNSGDMEVEELEKYRAKLSYIIAKKKRQRTDEAYRHLNK